MRLPEHFRRSFRLAVPLSVLLALGTVPARAQTAVTPAPARPSPTPAVGPIAGPATTLTTAPAPPQLAPEIQVVRFHGPEGLKLEVLGPQPESVAPGDGHGLATVGLRVGVTYRLRLSSLPGVAEGAETYPTIQVVGHLHRPAGIDASRYPIRVSLSEVDFADVVDRGRLVTQVIYLEDPDKALPITTPKDEIPVVTLNPSEEPLRVASALGRVMAVMRIGGRRPTAAELTGDGEPGLGLSGMPAPAPCPFAGADGGRCHLPCGPACGRPPAAGRAWVPRDEFLCDGGDRGEGAHFDGTGGMRGLDPRDAIISFDDGRRARILPTNMVCIYAPRFAEVRVGVGANETSLVESTRRTEASERDIRLEGRAYAKRLTQNQGAEANLHRARASGLAGRVWAGEKTELRVLSGYDNVNHVAGHVRTEAANTAVNREKPGHVRDRTRFEGIKSAESAVMTGIVEGAGEKIMSWKPHEAVGVETPPARPGLAVIKRVSAGEAEAGDVLTYVIQYHNMGNTPIRAVTISDSLLPRLQYVPASAKGPKGTVFTSGPNRAGSTELRWELQGAIPPGGEGYVEFQALVR